MVVQLLMPTGCRTAGAQTDTLVCAQTRRSAEKYKTENVNTSAQMGKEKKYWVPKTKTLLKRVKKCPKATHTTALC